MANYTKTNVGSAPRTELHDILGLTGAEVSINQLPAGAGVPFVHAHQQNEEIYGILAGKGKAVIDGEEIALTVPTAPQGKVFTGWKSSADGKIYTDKYIMPAQNVTLTAQFAAAVTVSYDGNADGKAHYIGEEITVAAAPAAQTGKVVIATKHSSYGNYIVVDHGGGISTLYAHCSKLLVSVGDTVKQGDHIAEMGATGNVTGPHLHFEVRVDGKIQDPIANGWVVQPK